jgi:hypothetical protein
MITFRSSVDKSEHRVIFSPRPGTSQGAKEITRKLIYGYRCAFCRNPILFAFLTPHKVSLRKFEESRVVNGVQEFHMAIPGEHSNDETAYHIDFIPVPGRTMGLQRVYMHNHILNEENIGDKDSAKKPNTPRCCPYTSIVGSREDLLIKDSILMGGFPERELAEYNLPEWGLFKELIKSEGGRLFFQEGIGSLPLVNVRSDFISEQKGIAYWRGVLLPFKKPKVVAGEAPEVLGTGDSDPDEPLDLDAALQAVEQEYFDDEEEDSEFDEDEDE